MRIPITQIPQADELSNVILTVEAVYVGAKTDLEIADYIGFTDRQGRYYRLAAEILGLLINEKHKNYSYLTEEGKEFIVLDEENRLKRIRVILRDNLVFKSILEKIEETEEGLTRKEIIDFLLTIIEGAKSTIIRRYSTLMSWLLASSLVKLDIKELNTEGETETLYKINEDLEESDFIENREDGKDVQDSIYPTSYSNNEELDIKESHIQVISLLRKKDQGKIVIPDFQRKEVWKPQQKSKFIESLILNIPIPPFYVSQDLEGKMSIVDGLQRFSAIFDFFADKYPLAGLEALPDLNGSSYSQLNTELKARIEDRELFFYVLKPSVPITVVYDIFNRINSNGSTLTRQEIRNCIYIGKSTKLLAELAEYEVFKKATNEGISPLRMKDREAILRFFAFSSPTALKDYKGNLDEFLGQTMKYINRMNDTEIEKMKSRFIRVMKLTYEFFKEYNFRLIVGENKRGIVNVALLEAICVFFDEKTDLELISNKENITKKYFKDLLSDKDFRNSIQTSTNTIKNVNTRFTKVKEILN